MSIRKTEERPNVDLILSVLKGFQRDTVEYAFHRLYEAPDSTRRFLVADEVGLGKTLVARGVIAKAIDHLWDKVDRIDIVYICSNAQIARQNVQRLQIGSGTFVRAERLGLLPKEIHSLENSRVNYIALSPGTSFNLRSRMGRWDERVILYHLIQRLRRNTKAGPKNLFQGRKSKETFRNELKAFKANGGIDSDLAEDFKQRLADEGDELWDQYSDLLNRFSNHRKKENVPLEDRRLQSEFVGRLRSIVAEICVEALEPDLIILDEFQRFKDLMAGGGAAADLAGRLFKYSNETDHVRLLLLSATPYKMYTTSRDSPDGNDHHEDFLDTVRFLDPKTNSQTSLGTLISEFRQAVQEIPHSTEKLVCCKEQIERQLRRVMSRTERLCDSAGRNSMIHEVHNRGLDLTAEDVQDYLDLQTIGSELNQPHVVEYWKSAPYLLSFMDGYRLKSALRDRLKATRGQDLSDTLTRCGRVSLPWESIVKYESIDAANARLRSLFEWIESSRAWRLLWMPPSLPYYGESEPWKSAREQQITKRLIFSTWQVVPKAVACLVSYEVERRISSRSGSSVHYNSERKDYSLLKFEKSKERLTGMSLLGILYPSPSLTSVWDPAPVPSGGATLAGIINTARERLDLRLNRLTEPYRDFSREDKNWYWVAPILLDLQHYEVSTREWFGRKGLAQVWTGKEGDDDKSSRWVDHVEQAELLVQEGVGALAQGSRTLGRPPEDLAKVLALHSIAAPANCALRALTNASGRETRTSLEARDAAGQIAWSFRKLFNSPEATRLIRSERSEQSTIPYWRQVVEYCAAGNLQAVMDEYIHALYSLEGLFTSSVEDAWGRLAEVVAASLSLRTGVPQVDEFRTTSESVHLETQKMRNHFAMRFGIQESDENNRKGAREGQVRQAFNSPFWPFVLVTTSVGQEGLDFHAYCHAIMHWNLPANPVDLEQREGRVHRFKGHAIRKNVALKHGITVLQEGSKDVWDALFKTARENSADETGLVPYWLFPIREGAHIERHVPALPLSRDSFHLIALKKSLALYRMVFGQPRQDDLVAFISEQFTPEELKEHEPLMRIDLRPRVAIDR